MLQPGPLTPAQRWGVAVATAAAARNERLLAAVLADARAEVEPAVVEDVDEAALAAVREARTAELVRRFELSPREEEVLRLLLIGGRRRTRSAPTWTSPR